MNTIQSLKKTSLLLIAAISLPIQIALTQETATIDQNKLAPFWEEGKNLLPSDPSVIWGKLDNGLHYAIMPNQEPPSKVSLRLLVNAGSLMETEAQRGLAHFLEHMSFKGGKNFPNQQALNEYFQRIGMAFGADTNAHTGFDQTVYKLELPKNSDEYLNDGLRVLRDFADGLLLNTEDIESERGVILAEKRDGYSVEQQIQDSFFEFAFPGTLLPKRFPIGLEEVIKNAPREEFVKFYKTWYNPDRFYLVATGDVDSQKMLSLIKKHFDSLTPSSTNPENPNLGALANHARGFTYTHNEITSTNLEFFVIKPHEKRFDTEANRIQKIQHSIPYSILTERLDTVLHSENAPFSSASAFKMDLFNAYDISYISLKVKPGMVAECIALAEQEVRRILQFGFTKEEMQTAIADTLNSYEQAVLSAPKRNTKDLSTSIVSTLTQYEVYTSPEEDLRLAQLALQNLTTEKCLELFSKDWTDQKPLLFLTGNFSEVKITAEDMLKVYEKSKSIPVEAQKAEPLPPFAYETFGKPGTIVEEKYFEKENIYQYRFANNVRLNLKKTDFSKDSIIVSVQFGSGLLELPPYLEGLDFLTTSIFETGALSKHPITEINRIFAGKTTSLCFSVKDTAFELLGCTNNRDFPDQISLMAAYLIEPGYRDEAFRLARHNFDELYEALDRTPENVLSNRVDRFLGNNHYLFGIPEKDTLYKLNKNNVIQWLLEPLSSGFLEISIVGDFDKDKVLSTIAKTFGSLPPRALTKDKIYHDQALTFPQGITKKVFPIYSEFEKAISSVYWKTTDVWNIKTNRKLSVLAAIFDDRLRKELREKLGEAYSPHASNMPSTSFKDYGRFFALAVVQHNQSDLVADIILNIGKEIFEKGVTEDEFNRALQPILHQIDTANRTNCYWLSVLNGSQLHPEYIEWAEQRKEQYQSLTPKDINQVAKEYLNPDKAIEVIIIANKDVGNIQK